MSIVIPLSVLRLTGFIITFCSYVIGTTFSREKWQIASLSCHMICSRRSIICLSLPLRQIIDLFATDKSRYFAQPRPIIVSYSHLIAGISRPIPWSQIIPFTHQKVSAVLFSHLAVLLVYLHTNTARQQRCFFNITVALRFNVRLNPRLADWQTVTIVDQWC